MQDAISKLNYTHSDFNTKYTDVINWVTYECSVKELKAELVTFAGTLGLEDIAESIPTSLVGVEGVISYCINHGAILPATSSKRVSDMLVQYKDKLEKESFTTWEELSDISANRKMIIVTNCYSRLDNERARFQAGHIVISDLPDQVRKIVSDNCQNNLGVVRELVKYYKTRVQDATDNEFTVDWVKPLQTILNTLNFIVSSAASAKSGAKKAHNRKMAGTASDRDRKGEKAAEKIVTADEQVTGIKSVDPKNVVGASAAVLYNTKNRRLEVYVATKGLLSVQSGCITGYDDAVSVGKVIRKPDEALPLWSRATNVKRLFVLGNGTNGKSWPVTGKISKNTIILKVL